MIPILPIERELYKLSMHRRDLIKEAAREHAGTERGETFDNLLKEAIEDVKWWHNYLIAMGTKKRRQ